MTYKEYLKKVSSRLKQNGVDIKPDDIYGLEQFSDLNDILISVDSNDRISDIHNFEDKGIEQYLADKLKKEYDEDWSLREKQVDDFGTTDEPSPFDTIQSKPRETNPVDLMGFMESLGIEFEDEGVSEDLADGASDNVVDLSAFNSMFSLGQLNDVTNTDSNIEGGLTDIGSTLSDIEDSDDEDEGYTDEENEEEYLDDSSEDQTGEAGIEPDDDEEYLDDEDDSEDEQGIEPDDDEEYLDDNDEEAGTTSSEQDEGYLDSSNDEEYLDDDSEDSSDDEEYLADNSEEASDDEEYLDDNSEEASDDEEYLDDNDEEADTSSNQPIEGYLDSSDDEDYLDDEDEEADENGTDQLDKTDSSDDDEEYLDDEDEEGTEQSDEDDSSDDDEEYLDDEDDSSDESEEESDDDEYLDEDEDSELGDEDAYDDDEDENPYAVNTDDIALVTPKDFKNPPVPEPIKIPVQASDINADKLVDGTNKVLNKIFSKLESEDK